MTIPAEVSKPCFRSSTRLFSKLRCRSVAAAGDLLFFVSPKKPKEKKGEPKSEGLLGSDANFAAVRSTAPSGRAFGSANLDSDPKNPAARRFFKCFWPLAQLIRAQEAIKLIAPARQEPGPEAEAESESDLIPQNPCECAEERSFKRIRASDCLSAASSSGTPTGLSTGRCPQRSGGSQTPGSPFLLLTLLLAKQKKSESPAAATERHRTCQRTQHFIEHKASTGSARTVSRLQEVKK